MSDLYSNAEWDEEHESYVFHSKYNFDEFKPLLIEHFEDGGSASLRVIAGVCRVSYATIARWTKEGDPNYKQAFHALIKDLKEVAVVETDKWHRQSASGRLKDANSATLNRRVEHMMGWSAKSETITKTHTIYQEIEDLSEDEVKERLKALEDK